ncbi:MAG: cation:proton antiporter [Gammaproteobacteria bacterium]|nr:cation:proton antiporter [Gammaproteobacteria bacterium]
MELALIAIGACGLYTFSLIEGRLRDTVLTPPMLFAGFGFLLATVGAGDGIEVGHGAVHLLAEVTLILVLFSDAARIDVGRLRREHNLPVRMLALGLPITIVLGTLVAVWMFPQFSIWEAALLAAVLAPTDAALGQTVVASHYVPVRIRQTINVESGLNDGIALPAVLLFAAIATGAASSTGDWIRFAVLQVTLGPLVGIAIGVLGAKLLDITATRGWTGTAFQGIGVLALAIMAFSIAELIGGNGFIAAFVAGLSFGNTIRHQCEFLFEFMESEGQLLTLLTFLIFGLVLLPEALHGFNVTALGYALLSLTVIRMLPIGLSLVGTGIRLPTASFLGWFGPRGLASILFALVILETNGVPHADEILQITVLTVAISILAHGVSASPLSHMYGAMVAKLGECEEKRAVAPFPLRSGPPKH